MLTGCARTPVASVPVSERIGIEQRLRADIAMLASEEFGGRKPGTPGEEATLGYLEQRFSEIGLLSGTGDPGSYWRAPVELVAAAPRSSRLLLARGRSAVVVPEEEGVAFTRRRRALAAGGPATRRAGRFRWRWRRAGFPPRASQARWWSCWARAGRTPRAWPNPSASARPPWLTVLPDPKAVADLRAANAAEKIRLASDEVDTLSAYITDSALGRVLGEARWQRLKDRSKGGRLHPDRDPAFHYPSKPAPRGANLSAAIWSG